MSATEKAVIASSAISMRTSMTGEAKSIPAITIILAVTRTCSLPQDVLFSFTKVRFMGESVMISHLRRDKVPIETQGACDLLAA